MENKLELEKLFASFYGSHPTEVTEISSGGSRRSYYKLIGNGVSVIGTCGVSIDENRAFFYLTEKFRSEGLNTPEIIVKSRDKRMYLQSEVGRKSLYEIFDSTNKDLLRQAIRDLVKFQMTGREKFDYSKCYPLPEMDRRAVLWDLNYFKYCFLKAIGYEIDEPLLEEEFNKIVGKCIVRNEDGFIYRDFQSRNIMVSESGKLGYIDFQGGRKGNGIYDLVSFVWQSRLSLPDELKMELVEDYLGEIAKYRKINKTDFYNKLYWFILFRGLQNLGAYGLRGITERKELFRKSIGKTLINLCCLPADVMQYLPYLKRVLEDCNRKFNKPVEEAIGLTVKVGSFSYKKGLPLDDSGNGGGFVFDCRGLHNPGRYANYKELTGRDQAVIEFLEKEESTEIFLENIFRLLDMTVEEYLNRNFTSLSVWTGCTGGRHRSVYFADRIANHLNGKYGVRVELEHRERGIKEILESK